MGAEIFKKSNPNDPRTEGEKFVIDYFENNSRFDGWKIYEEPHINGMKPDIIALNPLKGAVIIEIKDFDFSNPMYQELGILKSKAGENIIINPVKQVERYKNNILKYELPEYVDISEKNKNSFGWLETIVYYHGATKEQAENFTIKKENQYTKIFVNEDWEKLLLGKEPKKYTYSLTRKGESTRKEIQNFILSLEKRLKYSDFELERISPIILTPEQKRLSDINYGSIRRWSGVAGAGKTLVLCQKAVEAIKNDQKVLILTFNITLRFYIRDLCSQQFGGKKRELLKENLIISHYHGFINDIKHNVLDILEFDTILVDEGQDFNGNWILNIKEYYTGFGEFFIVYDKGQDIYNQGIWIENKDDIKNIGFKGQAGTLKQSRRMPNLMINKINQVNKNISGSFEKLEENNLVQTELFQTILFKNRNEESMNKKVENIYLEIEKLLTNNKKEDVVILTTNENTGASLVNYLSSKNFKNISHVYDLERNKDAEKRRKNKWKFQGGKDNLKVSTYHSFKGWESPNIIFILDTTTEETSEEIEKLKKGLLISMSRIKPKKEDGGFNFICINYVDYFKKIFDKINYEN